MENKMIARTWHGRVAAVKAGEYLQYLNKTGVRDLRKTEGNRGVIVLEKTEGEETHFLLISLWESIEAIKNFAGDDLQKAVYYPLDKEFLLEMEPRVTHYRVPVADFESQD